MNKLKLFVWNYDDDGFIAIAVAENVENARELIIRESEANNKRYSEARQDFPETSKYAQYLSEQRTTIHSNGSIKNFEEEALHNIMNDNPHVFELSNPSGFAYLFANNNE